MCFSTPKMSAPPVPRAAPEPAKLNDENVTRARDDVIRRARSAAGPGSTVRATSQTMDGAQFGTKTLLGQ